jgi:hypothetical protein
LICACKASGRVIVVDADRAVEADQRLVLDESEMVPEVVVTVAAEPLLGAGN